MSTSETLRDVIVQALSGRGAHVLVRDVVDGLGWELCGKKPYGAPHSVFEIVQHLIYWQEFSLAWIEGEKPATPERAAGSWPGPAAPGSADEWHHLVESFIDGLRRLEVCAKTLELEADRDSKTVLEILQLIASHNSYHAGQIASLRQLLDAWPPPAGGATW